MKKLIKNKKALSVAAVFLSLLLLAGAAMAYYTDRVTTFAMGRAGSMAMDVEMPFEEGKLVQSYNDETVYPISVTNTGNKLMDVKITMEIASSRRLDQGFVFSDYENPVPCVYVMAGTADSLAGIQISNKNSENMAISPSSVLLQPDNDSDGNLHFLLDEYTVCGAVDASAGITEVETFSGDETKTAIKTGTTSFLLYFPKYDSADFPAVTADACYQVTISIYAKQHRNTTDDDWTLVRTSSGT